MKKSYPKLVGRSNISLTIAIFIFFCPQILLSQKDIKSENNNITNRKAFVLFSVGAGIPLGDLESKNVENVNAGLAKLGSDFKIDGGYRILKYVGIHLRFSHQSFPIDLKVMGNYLAKQTPGISYSLKSTSGWKSTNMLFGIYGYFPLGKKHRCIFVPKMLGGYSLNNSPAYKITASKLINGITLSVTADQLSSRSQEATFSYNFGASLNYNLSNRVFINGNIDYFGISSKAYFKNVVINYSDGTHDVTDFKMDFQSLNITIGIGYCFGRTL